MPKHMNRQHFTYTTLYKFDNPKHKFNTKECRWLYVDNYIWLKCLISDIKPEGRNDAILVWAPAWDLPDAKGIYFL